MYFVGDVHGKTIEFEHLLERRIFNDCEEDEPVIQVGDMAIGFPKVHVPRFDKRVRWFRGNHDDPFLAVNHPNYMGATEVYRGLDWGYDDKYKLFWLAGAWSIDANIRLEWEKLQGIKTWWPEEQLSDSQLEAAYKLYCETKPEIVASHEAPALVVPHVLWVNTSPLVPGVFATTPSIKPGEPMHSVKLDEIRDQTGYYARKEKLGCVETRTSQTLQRMFNAHQPKHWVFGHYHISKQFKVEDTVFKCCAELEPYRIEQ